MKTTIHEYSQWRQFAESWANGKTRFLGVYGNPGLSKTYTITKVLGEKAYHIRCHGTPLQLYKALHDATVKKQSIVLDDIDSLLRNAVALNLLKGLFDTGGTVQWNSSTGKLEGVPKEFSVEPSCKIAVISNDEVVFSKHLRAVEDRGLVCHMAMDAAEVHRDVGEWWPKITEDTKECPAYDQEVFEYLGSILPIIRLPSQRAYANSATAKRDGFAWKQIVQDTYCLNPTQQFVRQLMLDSTLTAEERQAKFSARFQMSRATYYRLQGEITNLLHIKPAAYDAKKRKEREGQEKALSKAQGRPEPPTKVGLAWEEIADGNFRAEYRKASIRRETRNRPGKKQGTETIWWVSGDRIPGIGEDTHFPSFEDARRAVEEAWASEKGGE